LEYLQENGERSTNEVAKALGLTNDQARYHLSKLALNGKVKRRVASPRVFLWSVKKKKKAREFYNE